MSSIHRLRHSVLGRPSWSRVIALTRIVAIAATSVALVACPAAHETDLAETGEDGELALPACGTYTGTVDLGCSAPPNTFTTTDLTGTDLGSAFDAWAWSSFAALNWPALASSDSTTYPTGFVRGVPDSSKGFTTATSTDVAVWETFKEKRELFNATATSGAWQDFTFDPRYAPASAGGQVPACAGVDLAGELHARIEARPRVFAQIGKQDSAGSSDEIDTPDETAEVASPAQESTDQLCAGLSGSTLDSCQSILFPPPSSGAYDALYTASDANSRRPVGPRVFKGSPSNDNILYYEVKLNYDYYRYVADNGLNDYATAQTQAKAKKITLPYRTSAGAQPGTSSTSERGSIAVAINNADAALSYLSSSTAQCYGSDLAGCTGNSWGPIDASNLPQIGAVQLKAAWLPSHLVDGDLSDYHTTTAVYYETVDPTSPDPTLCYSVQEFALIGLHIIQRVHAGDPGTSPAETLGGTYVFATFEHESIADGAGYSYIQYFASSGSEQVDPQPYPNTAAGIQVARLQDYPLPTTATVNSNVHTGLASDSVWQNYRLIGTQFVASDSESSSSEIGQPHYLANLVVETSRGLQQFQGQPPGVQVISGYQGPLSTTYQFFSPTTPNMVYNGTGYNMGGCMGCHGVAQSQGFAFSFVLQDGDKGTKPDTADSVAIPPVPVPEASASGSS